MERSTEPGRFSQHREPEEKIPVLREDLRVGVERVETGRVRAVKKVHEENLIISGPVMNDELVVERIPLNKYLDEAPAAVRYEGETMVIPVVEEEVVVQTRLKLVEEIRITKKQVERNVDTPVTLRREEVEIRHDEKETE